MSRYDVVVIGAGAAGLSAGAVLAKEGKSVLVCEKSPYLGGRGARSTELNFPTLQIFRSLLYWYLN